MNFAYYVEVFVLMIMDALEELMKTVEIPEGKKLYEVFGVLIAILAFTVICKIIELPCFISWIEATVACGVMGLLLLVNSISKAGIEQIKNKFLRTGGRR